jgi:hypothetical protein
VAAAINRERTLMLKFATPERNLASHNPPEPPERDAASNVFTIPVRSRPPTRTTDDRLSV